ncbi:MAG: CocE/NonD family hydrolase [Thermodesulfobacteriota bacterium]
MSRIIFILLAAATLLGGVAYAAPTHFVTLSDGVEIALNVRMPDLYLPGLRYPTIFEMSGYDGGSASGGTLVKDFGLDGLPLEVLPEEDSRQLTELFYGQYVTVHASVRGSGCSSGEFDLFSWRSALDGKEIIDGWIAHQPWSNGEVGIVGHSYGGITGFMVAATQPRHLRAATVSGLIDDVYRALVYPGGVSNYGFPLLWTGGIRPAYDVAGGLLPGILRPQGPDDVENRQLRCAANLAGKTRTVLNDPLLQGLQETDNDWYRARSLVTYAERIAVPIHMTGAHQDEQTGPRGPAHLFERVQGVPKRLLLTNGDHNTESTASYGLPEVRSDRKAWMDHWVRRQQKGFGTLSQRRSTATVFFEVHRDPNGVLRPNGRKDGQRFPFGDTAWTDWYLTGDGEVTKLPPGGAEPSATYVSATHRQLWSYQAGYTVGPPLTTASSLPDELTYRSEPLAGAVTIAGPIAATLYVEAAGVDTELFVNLLDEAPDGSVTYLQRGLLRASHRAVDEAASDRTADGRIYRPHRPHTNPTPITPLATVEYLVEVWPVAHVFRPGHRIVVKLHAPPFVDSYYAYVPRSAPTANTVLHGLAHPSRIMLPVVPTPAGLGPELPCGAQEAVRCVAQPELG